MTRSIRLVIVASLSVLSADDETKMNRKKHESSLLEVFSDAGSTPAASTIYKLFRMKDMKAGQRSLHHGPLQCRVIGHLLGSFFPSRKDSSTGEFSRGILHC